MNDITPIQQAIKKIIETLQNIPQNIIPSNHVGMKSPIAKNDLPTVVISVKNIKELSPGIGNFIGIQKEDTDRVSEIKGSKISGVFQVNIWDLSPDRIDEITTAIIEIITTKKIDLEKDGFLYLSLDSFGEIAPSKLPTGPLKDAMTRLIEYQLIFELINRETFGPEGIIKEIHANIDDTIDEKMIIKK